MGLDGIQGKNLGTSLYQIGRTVANKANEVSKPVEIVPSKQAEQTTTRDKLDQLTKVTPAEIARAEATKDAAEVNEILASLGCNFKVTAAQVTSVANGLRTTLPVLDAAGNIATTARAEASIAEFENYMQALA